MAFLRRMTTWLAAAICLWLALAPLAPVSAPAEQVAREAALASVGVYVALRSVNAALSFAQEIEVGGSVGLSANARPLKFLEPVDDTVERVAGAVFSVALFAGVLAIGVGPVSSLGFLLLAVGLTIQAVRGPLRRHAGRLAEPVCRAGDASNLTGVLLAILLPLALVLGGILGEELTQTKRAAAMAEIAAVSDYSQRLLGAPEEAGAVDASAAAEGGFAVWLQRILGSAGQGVSDAIAQTDAYMDAGGFYLAHADELLEASLTLIAIFLLRTLVLPLALVVVMATLLRRISQS